jgi:serine/threonine protein kinase
MSPEQVQAMLSEPPAPPIDWRSDIYSLGVVVFEALAGRPPFLGRTLAQTAQAHVNTPPPQIRTFKPSLPETSQELVEKLLAKDPQQRFATASALAQALRDFSSGRWVLSQIG